VVNADYTNYFNWIFAGHRDIPWIYFCQGNDLVVQFKLQKNKVGAI